ncbi:MAG: hypothetical protein AAF483_20910 [Planctomycetota bacterium]
MIARKDRNETADLITSFLSGKLDKSQAKIWHRVFDSQDATVRYACEILGDYYEGYDSDVHLMEKSEWDHLERVRLVLLSDAQLQRDAKCRFSFRNTLCCFGLLAFGVFVLLSGTGWHLLAGTSILGVLLILFARFLPSENAGSNPYKQIIEPFVTIQQLSSTYKSTMSFRKNRFPRQRNDDANEWRHLSWLIDSFWIISVCGIVLLCLSPIILLVMAFPDCEPEFTVITSQHQNASLSPTTHIPKQ